LSWRILPFCKNKGSSDKILRLSFDQEQITIGNTRVEKLQSSAWQDGQVVVQLPTRLNHIDKSVQENNSMLVNNAFERTLVPAAMYLFISPFAPYGGNDLS